MYPGARDPTTPPQATDAPWFVEIVELARKGDKSAFDTLYQHFYTPICLYLAHMVGDNEEGHDLAQETFLKVWRSFPVIHWNWYCSSRILGFLQVCCATLIQLTPCT